MIHKTGMLSVLMLAAVCVLPAEGRAGALRAAEAQTQEVSAVGEATGGRYRFIDDTVLPEQQADSVKTRSFLYAGMSPVSVTEDGQTMYIGTDVRGSVRTITDRTGMVTARSDYDAFGNLLTSEAAGQCGLGYAGKPLDCAAELYDFGFRDYSPAAGRFTSVDPIRYGFNWYAYTGNDPVNYVDLWGLANIKPVALQMQDARWGEQVLGSSTAENAALVRAKGCYLTGYSSAAITLTGNETYTPDYFNSQSDLFDSSQNFNSTKASETTGLINDYWTKAVQGDLTGKINELEKSSIEYVVMAQIPYDKEGDLHWVEIYGGVDKKGYVNVVGTSQYDNGESSKRKETAGTWNFENNGVKIKASEINQLRTFTIEKEKESDVCGESRHY